MRISDWSSDVCSSDLRSPMPTSTLKCCEANSAMLAAPSLSAFVISSARNASSTEAPRFGFTSPQYFGSFQPPSCASAGGSSYRTGSSGNRSLPRSEEHTSELQSLMRNSYAVFCLKKKKKHMYRHILHKTSR